jgi:hypothetical protein
MRSEPDDFLLQNIYLSSNFAFSPEQQSMLEASLQAKISEIEFIIKGIFN